MIVYNAILSHVHVAVKILEWIFDDFQLESMRNQCIPSLELLMPQLVLDSLQCEPITMKGIKPVDQYQT